MILTVRCVSEENLVCACLYVLEDRRSAEGFEASLSNSVPFLTSSHWASGQTWSGMCVSVNVCVCVCVCESKADACSRLNLLTENVQVTSSSVIHNCLLASIFNLFLSLFFSLLSIKLHLIMKTHLRNTSAHSFNTNTSRSTSANGVP